MRRIDLAFLSLAAACLIGGVCLGIWMGIAHDFQLSPVHAHLNLVGWASLSVFGLVYRSYPQLGRSRLAALHLALAGPSAVAFPVGIYFATMHQQPALAIGASLMWLAGTLLFFFSVVRLWLQPELRVNTAAMATDPTL